MGMRPDFYGLRIAPAVSPEWKEFEISKVFRGRKLHITVQNPDGKESGFTSMTVNGKAYEDNYILADDLQDENEIVFVM